MLPTLIHRLRRVGRTTGASLSLLVLLVDERLEVLDDDSLEDDRLLRLDESDDSLDRVDVLLLDTLPTESVLVDELLSSAPLWLLALDAVLVLLDDSDDRVESVLVELDVPRLLVDELLWLLAVDVDEDESVLLVPRLDVLDDDRVLNVEVLLLDWELSSATLWLLAELAVDVLEDDCDDVEDELSDELDVPRLLVEELLRVLSVLVELLLCDELLVPRLDVELDDSVLVDELLADELLVPRLDSVDVLELDCVLSVEVDDDDSEDRVLVEEDDRLLSVESVDVDELDSVESVLVDELLSVESVDVLEELLLSSSAAARI
jgi:hypothetical protein